VERWLEGVYRVSIEPPREGSVGFDVYFERGGVRFKLHTDFSDFRLYCERCGGTAEGVLRTVAEVLGVVPRWMGNALDLPADVGWPIFLRLWERHNISLPIEDGGRELLRVEVLDVKSNGEAKFRLWYHKWRETRPHQPYVDVEIRPHPHKDGGVRFVGRVYANVIKGILREHLAEIAQLLRDKGMEGFAYYEYEKRAFLQFTGVFRDSVLDELGIKPELPRGEPPAVQHLGGIRFKVGGREVEFREVVVSGRYEFYAKLTFPSRDEAERFASSLKAVGVYAEMRGNTVRLDSDAFFGLLAVTNAAPPGLTPLYRSKEDDFRVYASAEEGRMRFYFAVKHEGAWKAAEGLHDEGTNNIKLWRKERDVLEALRGAVEKALEKLDPDWQSRPAKVEEPKEYRDEGGNIKGHYLRLSSHHLTPFLEHAADSVEAKPAEVRLEGKRIVISAGDIKTAVEFKLLKRKEAASFLVQDVGQTLALYKSLGALGVPVEITPKGVKVDGEATWALVATAIEKAIEHGAVNKWPTEVMPGVELLKVYSVGGMKIYIFRAEGLHYYFAVRAGQEWRAAGGKYSNRQVIITGEAVPTIAEAANAIYREKGVDRRVEVKYDKRYNAPYIKLTNIDLELLGLTWREP